MNKTRSNTMFIDRDMHRSKAFQKLSKSATTLFFEFLYRRKLEHRGNEWIITNNARITLSYREAQKLFGFFPSRMARAITQLVECGFIDIAHQGKRTSRDSSRYAISERWKNYGTEKFIEQTRQKDTRKLGFAGPKRKKITTTGDSGQLPQAVVIPLPRTVANGHFKRN
jgi:hypothetical protein